MVLNRGRRGSLIVLQVIDLTAVYSLSYRVGPRLLLVTGLACYAFEAGFRREAPCTCMQKRYSELNATTLEHSNAGHARGCSVKASVKDSTLELTRWMFLAPLYSAVIAFCLAIFLGSPFMIEMLFDPKRVTEGIGRLFDALYIWLGVGLMAGGYGFFLAVPAASLTGVAKIVIDKAVENPKYRAPWIYGVAVPVSTLAWFYYLLVYPRDFSFTGSYWGKPAYSLMAFFVGMGLVCCWLTLRRESERRSDIKSRLT